MFKVLSCGIVRGGGGLRITQGVGNAGDLKEANEMRSEVEREIEDA